jgi:aspartyl-tRNA(Asn)/glutamyl-tRNA(Gln) amidotransferase subunit A
VGPGPHPGRIEWRRRGGAGGGDGPPGHWQRRWGSIRIPASFTGVFGLKPTVGRVPLYPPSSTVLLNHNGPMARTVLDAAVLLDVIAGPDERDRHSLPAAGIIFKAAAEAGASDRRGEGARGLRVAWSPDLGHVIVNPEVRRVTEAAAGRFADLGCAVERCDPGFADPRKEFLRVTFGGLGAWMSEHLPVGWRDRVEPGLVAVVDEYSRYAAHDYVRATSAISVVWEATRKLFTRFDLLLTPAVAVPPFALGLETRGRSTAGPSAGWPGRLSASRST